MANSDSSVLLNLYVQIAPAELFRLLQRQSGQIVRNGIYSARLVIWMMMNQRLQAGRGHSPAAYIAGNEEEMKRLPPATVGEGFSGGGHPSFVELATGEVKRTSAHDITLYLNGGNQGLQFAAVGGLVYKKCREQELGHPLPTEWFLQDIRD